MFCLLCINICWWYENENVEPVKVRAREREKARGREIENIKWQFMSFAFSAILRSEQKVSAPMQSRKHKHIE